LILRPPRPLGTLERQREREEKSTSELQQDKETRTSRTQPPSRRTSREKVEQDVEKGNVEITRSV